MPLRRRAWLSREGVYYVGVLAFIVTGAILRSINLLVVLAGMLIAILLLNWRLVMASLRGLVVRRKLPKQISAGEPLTVEISLENTRRRLGSWLVTVEDWVRRIDDQCTVPTEPRGNWIVAMWSFVRRPSSITRAESLVAELPAQSNTTVTYRITLPRRGRYRFGPLRISTRYPLGLIWGHFLVEDMQVLTVAPRIGRLSPQWAHLLEAEQAGDQRRHPRRGFAEGDYYGLRPWQSGDSTRWIHWRTTAKVGAPTVLQFERQRNREVALVLDPWLPDSPAERDIGQLELAISLAATAVADLTIRGHSRLVMAVAGTPPQFWSGPASPMFCHEVLAQLAALDPTTTPTLEQTIRQARDQAPPGARMIVISPRPTQLAADPEHDNLCWIDVAAPELESLFTLG